MLLNSAITTEPLLPVEQVLFYGDIVKIGRFDCPSDHPCFASTAPLHNHLFVITHKPLWWRRGEGDYRFAGPGAALLHRAGGQVERRDVEHNGDFTDWFGIRRDVFEETLERNQLHAQNITERTVAWVTRPRFRLREAQLMAELQAAAISKLHVEESVLALFDDGCRGLSQNLRPHTTRGKTRIRRRRLADRTRYLLDDLENDSNRADQNPTLSDIANEVGASVYHLCRVFRDECGLSLHAYRQRQKLGRAIKLMQSSRQNLTELAHGLGFSSHSHFSRVFRQHLGVVPSDINYRGMLFV